MIKILFASFIILCSCQKSTHINSAHVREHVVYRNMNSDETSWIYFIDQNKGFILVERRQDVLGNAIIKKELYPFGYKMTTDTALEIWAEANPSLYSCPSLGGEYGNSVIARAFSQTELFGKLKKTKFSFSADTLRSPHKDFSKVNEDVVSFLQCSHFKQ